MTRNADFSRKNLELASDLIARQYEVRDEFLLGAPHYLDALHYVVDVLEVVCPPRARTLEVSCGTGILAEMVLERLPDVRLDVSDVSRETLEVVRRKTQRFGKRIRFLKKDNATYSFTGSYDAVVTTNAMRLNFLDYERLYRNFHRILRNNGLLLILEDAPRRGRGKSFLAEIGPHLNDVNAKPGSAKRWRAFTNSEEFTSQVSREDILRVVRSYSPAFHLRKLAAAGFDETDLIYKKYDTVLLAARKGKLSFAKHPRA